MDRKKIVYISSVRYPTEKAYGVTVFHTMKALEKIGFSTLIFEPFSAHKHMDANNNRKLLLSVLSMLLSSSRNTKTKFHAKRILMGFLGRSISNEDYPIIWTRDPIIGILGLKKRRETKLVIEVHQNLSFLDKIALKALTLFAEVVIAPISLNLKEQLEKSKYKFDASKIVLCPMGVPDTFFKARTPRRRIDIRDIRMSYVGGLKSNGIDQGIKEIVSCISTINNQSKDFQIKINLYGLSESEENEMRLLFVQEYQNRSILSQQRQSHEDLIPKIQNDDIFLLPYPEGDYFHARFPLKALEYAALGRPIMVSDTPSHRNIFHEDEVWFFDYRSCNSFEYILRALIEHDELTSSKIKQALIKAENHSYTRRVEPILSKLNCI